MRTYIVEAKSVRIAAGVLALSKAQAAARLHLLEPLKDGEFRVVSPVEFKTGEEFGYDGELPKGQAALVRATGDDAPLIDRPVRAIRSALPGLTAEELHELKFAEESGRKRKSVINAIVAEHNRRAGETAAAAGASGDGDGPATENTGDEG